MKITNSNKKELTVTIKGNASEMAVLFDLANRMAKTGYDASSGLEKEHYSGLVDEYSDLLMSIQDGGIFS